ncbi:hypothetical protein B0H19DRAFT_1080233 [Mycena capillaripes]|nr:hypothetical protein B0H19DRAFT_1080233 [Mycena capillaripes]
MDPPNQPLGRAPDPAITALHTCPKCSAPLGSLCVHKGTTGHGRGNIVQTHNLLMNHSHVMPRVVQTEVVFLDRVPTNALSSESADSAVQIGSDHDSCKAHNTPASEGPQLAQPPARPQYAPPPPHVVLQPPGQHIPLPPQLPLQYPPPVQPPQPRAGPSHLRGHGGGHGIRAVKPLGRLLANPLSNNWGNKTFAPVNHADTGKVARQKLDITVSHNVELAIYHTKGNPALRLHHQVPSLQMQFIAHPTLMNDLQITESTWFDLYMNGDWRTFQAATHFAVDKQRRSILRLRPSLRVELALEDCPGIDNLMSQQRKHVGTDLVSLAKKLARTNTASTPTQACQIIEIPDSPPPTSFTCASGHPLTISASASSSTTVMRPAPIGTKFPWLFSTVEHKEAWDYYATLRDSEYRVIPKKEIVEPQKGRRIVKMLHNDTDPYRHNYFDNVALPVDVFHFKSKHKDITVPVFLSESMVREMPVERYNFFLDEMIKQRNCTLVRDLHKRGRNPGNIPREILLADNDNEEMDLEPDKFATYNYDDMPPLMYGSGI